MLNRRLMGWILLGLCFSSCSSLRKTQTGSEIVRDSDTGLKQTKIIPSRHTNNPGASAEYHFTMAQAYSAEGKPDRAIEEYKLTLLYDPKSALVYARLATEYVKKGMLSEAMEACLAGLKRDENFLDARLLLAGLYSSTQDSASAIREYDRILAQKPDHEEALVYKVQLLLEEEHSKEAQNVLKSFIKKNPDSALAWFYLARSYQRSDQFEEAAKAYAKVLEFKPGFVQAGLGLGFLYEEQGLNDRALEVYKKLFDDTQDLTAANRIATLLLKAEKYPESLVYLESIGRSDPDDLNIQVKLGLVQMELKKFDQSIETFLGIIRKSPESDRVRYYLGSVYEETKQYEKAIQEYVKVPIESKLYTDAVLHVAFLKKQLQRSADAKNYIQEAIKRTPRVAGFHLFHATLEEESKNLTSAIGVLENAVKYFPEDDRVLYYLGSLYDRVGRVDEGMQQMEAIIRINPEHADALNYLGYTWTVRGTRLNEAELLLKKALKLKPGNPYIQDSWGWYLFVRGRFQEAVVQLEQAVKIKGDEPTILEHLGDAYSKLNLREKALEQYRQAAIYSTDDDVRQKILSKYETLRQNIETAQTPTNEPIRTPASQTDLSSPQ